MLLNCCVFWTCTIFPGRTQSRSDTRHVRWSWSEHDVPMIGNVTLPRNCGLFSLAHSLAYSHSRPWKEYTGLSWEKNALLVSANTKRNTRNIRTAQRPDQDSTVATCQQWSFSSALCSICRVTCITHRRSNTGVTLPPSSRLSSRQSERAVPENTNGFSSPIRAAATSLRTLFSRRRCRSSHKDPPPSQVGKRVSQTPL